MPVPATPPTDASLLEIFSSIQGEGLLLGCRQIFLRFAQCNLQCAYCDTPVKPTPNCRVEDAPGSENFISWSNPLPLDTLVSLLHQWKQSAPGLHHSISLTGGEPLLQDGVLSEWLPELRKIHPLYLETNGTLPDALRPLVEHLDWVSMDIKLSSSTGAPTPWEAHRDFLEAMGEVSAQVKVVVGESTETEEILQAAKLVQQYAPGTPLILMPETRGTMPSIGFSRLFRLQEKASFLHPDVRVIPQIHPLFGFL